MTGAERVRRHRRKIAGRSRAEGGDELHETPARAVHALLGVETLPQHLWEPQCGYGAIVRILRTAGHDVVASDHRAYGSPPDQDFVADFLTTTAAPEGVEAAVMNPPFSKAAEHIRHALTLCPKVFVLVRLAFLESTTARRDIMEGGQLARVHVFRKRLPRMHRHGWTGRKSSAKEGYAWCVWDRAHDDPPMLHWL
jgi:hypothetical protein